MDLLAKNISTVNEIAVSPSFVAFYFDSCKHV